MFFLQNLFFMKMPLFKEIIYSNEIGINSFFMNFPINKNNYFSGQIGLLLMIIFELKRNNLKWLSYFGYLYLINLMIYLMAIHHSNSLNACSSIISALYFDKISEEIIEMRNIQFLYSFKKK